MGLVQAEHRHHRVAHEFLDGAAVGLDRFPRDLVIPGETPAYSLRIKLLSQAEVVP